jgi:hypothetical protein
MEFFLLQIELRIKRQVALVEGVVVVCDKSGHGCAQAASTADEHLVRTIATHKRERRQPSRHANAANMRARSLDQLFGPSLIMGNTGSSGRLYSAETDKTTLLIQNVLVG